MAFINETGTENRCCQITIPGTEIPVPGMYHFETGKPRKINCTPGIAKKMKKLMQM